MPFPGFVKGHMWGTLIGVHFRSQGDRQGRPYSPTHRLAKPVYSRGDPGGRPIGVKLRMVEVNNQVTTNDSCEKIAVGRNLLQLLEGVN